MDNEKLTIGKLAKSAKVGVETIRFYERKGILQQPEKAIGFRYYPQEYISRIKFVKRSQELGFTLQEAKELLDLTAESQSKCSDVLEKANHKIEEIEQKISDLKKMKKSLNKLSNCCEDTSISLQECPLLKCFMEI